MDFSASYPPTTELRERAVADTVPTNAPLGSVYEVRIYIVQPGDTLAKVLERFHLTVQELASLNISNDAVSTHLQEFYIGQCLIISERISQ